MTRKAVDLAVVRESRARLDALARAHPEAFAADRLPSTPEAVQAMLRLRGRPPLADPTEAIALRLPRSLIADLDQRVAERRQSDPKVTRQDVLHDAVRLYLAKPPQKVHRGL
jgi:hypothetical protein